MIYLDFVLVSRPLKSPKFKHERTRRRRFTSFFGRELFVLFFVLRRLAMPSG